MSEVVILQKASRSSLERFKEALRRMCGGLRVKFSNFHNVTNGWIKVKVNGEDEKAAINLLAREIGLAPVSANNVTRFSVWSGRIIFSRRSKLLIDIGVFSPNPIYASIPLSRLQAQLVDGEECDLDEISELYGLVDGIPLEIRVVTVKATEFEAELTQEQMRLYHRWIDSRLDRLIVLGSTYEEVVEAIRKARFVSDVTTVASLGMLEQLIVCKLGTDAAGLIRRLGRRLRYSTLVCFSPRNILRSVLGRW